MEEPMKQILAVLPAFFLVACSMNDMPPPDAISRIHSIGVIVAVGDKFTLRHDGVTVFTNTEQTVPIDSWGLDRFLANRATILLKPKFDVKAVAYDRAEFAPVRNPGDDLRSYGDKDETPVGDLIASHVSPHDLDAYLVLRKEVRLGSGQVFPAGMGLNPFGQSHWVPSVGIYSTSSGVGNEIKLYAGYRLSLVDGHSLKEIGWVSELSSEDIDQSLWADAFEQMSEVQRQQLRASLERILDRSLVQNLTKIGLVQ
jgi:hypothetical protein